MIQTPTSGLWEGRDHLFPIRVYYEDTDFSGFVYHGSYVRFFERGRSEALRLIGVRHGDLSKAATPMGLVVRRMEVDYRLPLVIDDAVIVRTVMQTARGARMTLRQQIERGGEIAASAQMEIALIALTGRPMKIPPTLAAQLEPWLQPLTP